MPTTCRCAASWPSGWPKPAAGPTPNAGPARRSISMLTMAPPARFCSRPWPRSENRPRRSDCEKCSARVSPDLLIPEENVMMRWVMFAAGLALIAGPVRADDEEPKLNVGDKAPKLEIKEFVKGEAVKELAKGNIHVVE